ncbi:MAG: hypothetical protein ABR968_11085 [Bacteroidales bacterium]|jgi:hypothetical protein
MKNPITLLLILTALTIASCKHISFSHPMSISELITFTDQHNTDCKSKLRHDGEEAVIVAYIQKLNTFPKENRFQIFESTDIGSSRIDVNVSDKSMEVFTKISQQLGKLGENDFVQIKVKGVITGKALAMNGNCRMGVLLTISSPDYIKF